LTARLSQHICIFGRKSERFRNSVRRITAGASTDGETRRNGFHAASEEALYGAPIFPAPTVLLQKVQKMKLPNIADQASGD
jgi:hypothetical protein